MELLLQLEVLVIDWTGKMKFFEKSNIIGKIFLYLLGFSALIISLLWFFQIVFLNDFYKLIRTNEIKKAGEIIEKNLSTEEPTNEMLNEILEGQDVFAEIIDSEGNLLLEFEHNKMYPLKMSESGRIKIYEETVLNGKKLEYLTQGEAERIYSNFQDKPNDNFKNHQRPPKKDDGGRDSIVYSKLIENFQGKTVVLLLNMTIIPVDSTIKTLRLQLFVVTVVMIILSIFLAFFISRKISAPIISINETAKILAERDFNVVFRGTGYKEISELSDTMNYLTKELSKVDELRRELIANISHDLRTPLTVITGYAEAMRDLPEENNKENAQIIIDESKRLSSLVTDVLDISRLSNESLSLENYNFTKSISESCERILGYVKNEGYEIKLIYDKEVKINGDKSKISQVIYNLLINAVNYTGEDKFIEVKQIVKENIVRLEIKDTGSGIPLDEIPLIWERYYRLKESHKRPVAGTGLGLSIVKEILESHGSKYGVISEKAKGSIFWFELPLVE